MIRQLRDEYTSFDSCMEDSDETIILGPSYHDVEQGSEEWHKLSNKSIFRASCIAAYMGIDPYRSRKDIWLEKKGLKIIKPVSSYTQKKFQWGHDHEQDARDVIKMLYTPQADHELQLYNRVAFSILDDEDTREKWNGKFTHFIEKLGCFSHHNIPLTVSPDMLAVNEWSPTEKFDMQYWSDITGGVEIKCPENLKVTRNVPVHHMTQVQAMAETIGVADWMYFQWTPETYRIFPVERSTMAWDKVIWPALEKFARYLEGNVTPPNVSNGEKLEMIRRLCYYCPETSNSPKSIYIQFDDIDFSK